MIILSIYVKLDSLKGNKADFLSKDSHLQQHKGHHACGFLGKVEHLNTLKNVAASSCINFHKLFIGRPGQRVSCQEN